MKKTLLALTMAMAAASGAHASWDTGSYDFAVGNGEALLTVFDDVAKKSYALDLGVRYDDLISGAAFNGQSFAVDLSVFGGNLSNVQWQVAAASSQFVNADFTEERFDKYGFLFTTNATQTRSVAGYTPETQSNLISGVVAQFNIPAGSLNMNSGVPSDNTSVTEATPSGIHYVGSVEWGSYFDSKLAGDSLGVVGETQSLWRYGFDGAASTSNPIAAKIGSLTLTGTTLTLNAGNTPTVPVPAAIWLLGSALAGLGGVARSRRKA